MTNFFVGSILIVAIPILFAAVFWPDAPVSEVSYPISPPRRVLLDQSTHRGGGCRRKNRLVLTMSTSFDKDIKPTVDSLLEQSCRADALYVFVMGNQPSTGWRDEASSSILWRNMAYGTYGSSSLLAVLEEERDPSTWIITVEDDMVYHQDMVMVLVTSAQALPSHMAPAFWCAQAFVQFGSMRYSTLPAGSPEGTMFGWCYSFAGVLYKRWFFDDQVFRLGGNARSLAPDACKMHTDVWAGGHMLSKGDREFYLVNPGFMPFVGGIQKAYGRGLSRDSEATCASWFAAFWGVFARPNDYRHPHFQRREKDLKMLQSLGDRSDQLGVFLESRAPNGPGSISYFFEKEMGWKGILVEPSEILQPPQAERNRSLVLQTAICGQAGRSRTWLEAFDGDVKGVTVAAFEDTLDQEFVRLMDFTQEVRRTPLRCQQLQEILQEAAMPKLQFLALDSTWDAMDILSNFNFQDHDLEVIYLEVKRNKCRFLTKWNHPLRSWSWSCEKIFEKALKGLLAANGYILVDTVLVDIGGLPSLAHKQTFFHYAQEVTVGLFFRRPQPDAKEEPGVISSCTLSDDQTAEKDCHPLGREDIFPPEESRFTE